jgi:cyclophilin family peptidyl-prolyl cis-trans isomerase
MRSIRSLFVGVFALGVAGCGNGSGPVAGASSASASASASTSEAGPTAARERLLPIVNAELRRAADEITTADVQSRDVVVRRAAARALARIGGEPAHAGLVRALGDEDDEVIAWAAYGLGFSCKGHEKDSVAALVARALSRPAAPAAADAAKPPGLDADAAIRRAIGRCGAEASEPTLVAWLAEPRSRAAAAAYALGDLATAKQKLREETLVALLNLAAGSASAPPIPEALFPVSRLENVPLSVVDRIREVATARLNDPSEARIFAVRALGRAGDGAADTLAHVLNTPASFAPPERAEAARQLKRLGKAGQRALGDALPALVPSSDPVALTGLVGEDFGVLLAVIQMLDGPGSAKKALAELAALPAPPKPPEPVARRLAWLRCSAARVLAGANYRDKALLGCEAGLEPPGSPPAVDGFPMSSIAGRAVVAAIGGAEIAGPRLVAFRAYALHGDRRAREAALELLEKHDEVDSAAAILVEALGAKETGIVEGAADVLAKKPQRAGEPAKRKGKKEKRKKADREQAAVEVADPLAPSPTLVKALLAALAQPAVDLDPELSDSLIDAVGALALKEAKARLDVLCGSNYPTTREHAAKALALLGDRKECPAHAIAAAPRELDALVTAKTTIAFEADPGSLTITLDPALAPAIITRVVELVKSGYYDGMIVHRVEPWYVTQFGAPFGDGSGGPEGKAAIPCETTPLPFAPLSVGIALSGRDTGSSQLFVMHTRAPNLDGNYAIIGTATGPWGAFVDGDSIRHAKIAP